MPARVRVVSSVAVLAIVTGAPVRAQGRAGDVVIRVHVADSARAPVGAADVSVIRGLSDQVASGATDLAGERTFRVARNDSGYQVVVRKVGFARYSQLVGVRGRDTVVVNAALQRAVQQLAGVKVTAEQSLKHAKQSIDADGIAASNRPLVDAVDIILKLRPDMVWGIRGPPILDDTLNCKALATVWVNGELIRNVSPDPGLLVRREQDSVAIHLRNRNRQSVTTPVLVPTPLMAMSLEALSILASIKPDHIESMEYRSCDEVTDPRPNTSSAMFVTLKPGVEFEAGVGSHVSAGAGGVAQTTAAAAANALPPEKRYRARLLGLFDAGNGSPIAAADVTHVATGAKGRTSSTGTVSLTFLPDGGGVILVSKPGYATDTLTVVISPADTSPVTMILHKM